jgi:Holliday junction resolvase RusA-like endonuclease
MNVTVWIPGNPPVKNQMGDLRRPYNPCAAWEKTAARHAVAQLNQQGARIPLFPYQPVAWRMVIFYDDLTPRPHGKARVMRKPGRPADNPNYYKATCDAMNGVLYTDDRQIRYTAHALVVRSEVRDMTDGADVKLESWPLWAHGGGILIEVSRVDVGRPWRLLPIQIPDAVHTRAQGA